MYEKLFFPGTKKPVNVEVDGLLKLVELRGIEPLSKHILQKLSTCLFHD